VGAPGAALGSSPTSPSRPVSKFCEVVDVGVSAAGVTEARDTSGATADLVESTAVAAAAGVAAGFGVGAMVSEPGEGEKAVGCGGLDAIEADEADTLGRGLRVWRFGPVPGSVVSAAVWSLMIAGLPEPASEPTVCRDVCVVPDGAVDADEVSDDGPPGGSCRGWACASPCPVTSAVPNPTATATPAKAGTNCWHERETTSMRVPLRDVTRTAPQLGGVTCCLAPQSGPY
jgi:hypothetical protein